ncbi:MAG TPA: ABC transporter permease [Acidimicrobiales bacterium]|nr:ABC transporter permease [Acidimicrobiales bacterium]
MPSTAAVVVALVVIQQVLWPAPAGVLVRGVIIGGLTALISLGIALVYRANRIVNFAQGDLGTVPTMGAVLLIVGPGVPWFVALVLGLVVAALLGALTEFLIIRRFASAPRLILTVATLGVAQVFAALALGLPSLANNAFPGTFDISPPTSYPSPFDLTFEIPPVIFHGNDVIAVVAVLVCIAALVAFFRFTNTGIAVRASAESADRAMLLGIPVKRVQMVVWAIASVLAFVAVFLRAGVVGVPLGSVLGPAILVRALAACVIGGMTNMPLIVAGAVTLGVIEQAIVWNSDEPALLAAVLFVIVLAVLLVQKRERLSRGEGLSSWQVVTDVRRIPAELADLPEVRWVMRGLLALLAALVLSLPVLLSTSRLDLVGVILVYAMVGVSLVVLTGWAGQVSLGAVAFLAIGAAVGGAVTARLGWDLSIALVLAGLVGAAISIVIGLPALRIRGLLLAVTTLAFAQAVAVYGLNRSLFDWWLPLGRLERPDLFGLVPIASETNYYYFVVSCLLLVLSVAKRLRRSRVGRVMIGVRENDRAAQAFGVSPVRAKLTAFAVSGFVAAFAGAVFVHHQQSLGIQPYATEQSLAVFAMVVIGGLGSLPGAILGAVYVMGLQYFLPDELAFFAGGAGLLLVLLTLPGGLGSLLYLARDEYLRWVAQRRQIMVPSLFADAADMSAVGLSRERGMAFLREIADRMDAGDQSALWAPDLPPPLAVGPEEETAVEVAAEADAAPADATESAGRAQ